MIKPASSLCNLGCKYCFYSDVSSQREITSYGIMPPETAASIIKNVFSEISDGSVVNFGFQGGEPTLAGIDFFKNFVSLVTEELNLCQKSIRTDYSLQTNGILLDNEWCEFLHENNFLVGLSLDGDAELHNMNRVDSRGKGSFSRVIAAKQMLDMHKVEYNLLTVLTNHLARYPKRIWRFLCEQNIKYVQFIPCLSELDGESPSPYALTPDRFASFYTTLFKLWADEFRAGRYISVKFFDDIFNLLLRHRVTSCGFTGQCQRQIVVEADGSVYPCDFYAIDKWRIGNLAESSLVSIMDNALAKEFMHRPKRKYDICGKCRWAKLCGGGCARMTDNMYVSNDGKYCGYSDFLNNSAEEINRIAEDIYRDKY